jgi:hypothetical protein
MAVTALGVFNCTRVQPIHFSRSCADSSDSVMSLRLRQELATIPWLCLLVYAPLLEPDSLEDRILHLFHGTL